MRIIIIEDEKHTANNLAKTLTNLRPEIEIVAIINSVDNGNKYFSSYIKVDLIFSDIQLGDGLAFDILDKVNDNTPVIFCTAYNEYALQAFKNFGIEYLLKPFSNETVNAALTKFEALKSRFDSKNDDIRNFISEFSALQTKRFSSILITKADKIIPIPIKDVLAFYIENGLVFAVTNSDKKVAVNYQLEKLEQLTSPNFYRVNRQFLVNRKAIKDASIYFNRKLLVNLVFPFECKIVVSKEKVTDFLNWLAN
ncbi:LytTR family DNA-binding domain-containing protein [Flavobacterium sp.]|uniref:LytR/AlgR family response regulator transcription factor n=1 Tax=Flavobacterium sp. TaxID=239 RepID=UPI00261247FE|nr:LytTR family DNA-binding domain-containing protein [Flavobacterium sp.]